MKANKQLGNPRNKGNKTAKNEINEVLGEERKDSRRIKVFISTRRN